MNLNYLIATVSLVSLVVWMAASGRFLLAALTLIIGTAWGRIGRLPGLWAYLGAGCTMFLFAPSNILILIVVGYGGSILGTFIHHILDSKLPKTEEIK